MKSEGVWAKDDSKIFPHFLGCEALQHVTELMVKNILKISQNHSTLIIKNDMQQLWHATENTESGLAHLVWVPWSRIY